MTAEDVRLDQGGTGADKRVVHAVSGFEVPVQEDLDELRDELAEVGVQRMDVLRALNLGELALRPGELQVDLSVESFLRSAYHREDRV